MQAHRKTHLSIVRFGNVLGSSGSVVPLFQKQIKHGGPITLSHEDITRYFMTISEAAQLVMQAGTMSGREDSAEVFVLDMGEPVRIIDLAHRMVALSGLRIKDKNTPEGDIAIEVTGLRPGEKLYEELLFADGFRPNVGASVRSIAPFPVAAHRTGRANFSHPALTQDFVPSRTAGRLLGASGL